MLTRKQIEKRETLTTPVYNATIKPHVKMVASRRYIFEPFSYTPVDDDLVILMDRMLENEKIGCFVCFGDEDFETRRITALKNYVSDYGHLSRQLRHWKSREEEEIVGGRIFVKPKAYLELEKEKEELLKYLGIVTTEEKRLSYFDNDNKTYQNDKKLEEKTTYFDIFDDIENEGTPKRRGRPKVVNE